MILPLKPFYFIRHGETDWNVQNIVMGSTDIPLNERGMAQATQVRKLLETLDIGQIFSSPSQRASQTAAILNEGYDYSLHYVDQFKERGWGEWEGKQRPHKFDQEDLSIPKGAEPFSVFKSRVMTKLNSILKSEIKSPLIVSHGGVFMAIAHSLGYAEVEAKNCSLYKCDPPQNPQKQWVISHLNERI